MKKKLLSIISIVLCLSLLSGCNLLQLLIRKALPMTASFSDMTYTRPSLGEMEKAANNCISLAKTGNDLDALVTDINNYSMELSDFMTNYALAYIHYSLDSSSEYWKEEYNYCLDLTTQAESMRDKLMRALAKSPLREDLESDELFGPGAFDSYDGESIWTDAFTALMDRESELQAQYYDQLAQNDVDAMEQTFVEMIRLRQQIAQEAGYADYPSFAYDFYFQRDYTPQQILSYTEKIKQTLSPLYEQMIYDTSWYDSMYLVSSQDTFSYVEQTATAMGGSIDQAFRTMEQRQLYHIAPGENKLQASFEVYLPNYMAPYVFVNPTGTNQDYLSFAHEFGHFCNDYVTNGGKAGIDVAEVFSQAMEYLSLIYGPQDADCDLIKMYTSLSVYVEQSAYASFELQVYQLTGDELNVDNVRQLFQQTCADFGMPELLLAQYSYTSIVHFFISPMYVISYVVSNDTAMQIYQMELTQSGAGLDCYVENLSRVQPKFLQFLKEAGLDSPFRPGRLEEVRQTLTESLTYQKSGAIAPLFACG